MKNSLFLIIQALLLAAVWPLAGQDADPVPLVHHRLSVGMEPEKSFIRVTDTVRLPEGMIAADGSLTFWLHENLAVVCVSSDASVTVDPSATAARPHTANEVPLVRYRLHFSPAAASSGGFREVTLSYSGCINHAVRQAGGEYARGFSETPGLVCAAGAYLAGSSGWVPWFDDQLLTFRLDCELPGDWDVIAAGKRGAHVLKDGRRITSWLTAQPVEEVHLLAGPFKEFDLLAGRVTVMAFLRSADQGLADRYLQATGRYLEMYERLIGPYPFAKFALVENFWETGYGMPSFTLLGPTVIRFPFILTSSYPHELLHNWWGNGVYVAAGGNWCEGLTSYLADHLFKEQQGQGAEYRRTALQEYTHYASGKPAEFPLVEFTARSDALSSAIGYGKSMMLFHMLRCRLGDAAFIRALQQFYRDHLFRKTSFADMQEAFTAAGADMRNWSSQWLQRRGVPELRLAGAIVTTAGTGYRLRFSLHQVQADGIYELTVPLVVTLEGQTAGEWRQVVMSGRRRTFNMRFDRRPLRLDIDPEFDLFRKLHGNEIPPALSGAFGADKVLLLLPEMASAEMIAAYRELAQIWSEDKTKHIEVRFDRELSELPSDCAVWLLGSENCHRPAIVTGLAGYGLTVDNEGVERGGVRFSWNQQSMALVARNSRVPEQMLVLLAADSPAAIPGLARKLPHYGKYGFLVFGGVEPVNSIKEVWPATGSPLVSQLGPVAADRGALPRRPPLVEAPAAFSTAAMMATVRALASEELEGRGIGSKGLEKAAAQIAVAFRDAGLEPGGDGSFMQTWQTEALVQKIRQQVRLHNVIGFIPGTKPEWAEQALVVCAHYDHLGLGWPEVHSGDENKIHYGANDNASGVAVLIELARALAAAPRPERTIIFAAFSGEESGLLGSAHFVNQLGSGRFKTVFAALNLDTVGRLPADGKLLVIGAASAREWPFLFMGVAAATGIPIGLSPLELVSGDHASFIAAGIPAVQLFSGANVDYHRPADSADKIDPVSLLQTAEVAHEALLYLAGRIEPLSFSGSAQPVPVVPVAASGQRAATGLTPDFTFSGPGVRIAAVAAGSPAVAAGLQIGDVVIRLGTAAITDLRSYAEALRARKPGDRVRVVFLRDDREHSVDVVLGLR